MTSWSFSFTVAFRKKKDIKDELPSNVCFNEKNDQQQQPMQNKITEWLLL